MCHCYLLPRRLTRLISRGEVGWRRGGGCHTLWGYCGFVVAGCGGSGETCRQIGHRMIRCRAVDCGPWIAGRGFMRFLLVLVLVLVLFALFCFLTRCVSARSCYARVCYAVCTTRLARRRDEGSRIAHDKVKVAAVECSLWGRRALSFDLKGRGEGGLDGMPLLVMATVTSRPPAVYGSLCGITK